MLSLISQTWYDSDHDYYVGYTHIFKYETNTHSSFNEYNFLFNLLAFFQITDII